MTTVKNILEDIVYIEPRTDLPIAKEMCGECEEPKCQQCEEASLKENLPNE